MNVRPTLEVLFIKSIEFVVLHDADEILEKGVVERGFFVRGDVHASTYELHCFSMFFPAKGMFGG